ncbi:hypothetical protein OnM2_010011 [Erysiphe neolycopersici]|uniref:Uncharacterized protein n=1 Tax=Erysiphe neolycopersici TaxID=212602 RepID=A0A420I6J6_9PEZI|nr:hypothetical protein OnM2_010011 [Erysiphe neolycopersici]
MSIFNTNNNSNTITTTTTTTNNTPTYKRDNDDDASGEGKKKPLPPSSQVKIYQSLKDWGCSPLPPTILATFITALHFRPFQAFPMIFPPVLLFTSYLNLQDLTKESAGLSATWSGLIRNRFLTARSMTTSAAIGLAAINCVCGGLTYYGFGTELDESVI